LAYIFLIVKKKSGIKTGAAFMSKIGNYIQEAYDELLHKVSWPTWDELQQTTIIVLVALMIVTAVIFGMDFVGENILKFIYNIIGK
jgi:preprotein translocase subunit SecE